MSDLPGLRPSQPLHNLQEGDIVDLEQSSGQTIRNLTGSEIRRGDEKDESITESATESVESDAVGTILARDVTSVEPSRNPQIVVHEELVRDELTSVPVSDNGRTAYQPLSRAYLRIADEATESSEPKATESFEIKPAQYGATSSRAKQSKQSRIVKFVDASMDDTLVGVTASSNSVIRSTVSLGDTPSTKQSNRKKSSLKSLPRFSPIDRTRRSLSDGSSSSSLPTLAPSPTSGVSLETQRRVATNRWESWPQGLTREAPPSRVSPRRMGSAESLPQQPVRQNPEQKDESSSTV